MKKLILIFGFLFIVFNQAKAVETPARNISTDCTSWTKNLNCTMTNQQLVDNAVDQLSGSGGGSPAGSDNQIQINNNGVFGGGNMYSVGSNMGIGTTLPNAALAVGTGGGGSLTGNGFTVTSLGNITTIGGVQANVNAGGWNQINENAPIQFGNYDTYGTNDSVKLYTTSTGGHIDIAPSSTNGSIGSVLDTFNASGNIGVGTTLPAYQIDEGTGTLQSGDVHFQSGNLNLVSQYAMNLDPTGGGPLVSLTYGRLVGINNQNPSYQLDVSGTIRATGFTMSTGASSGYVLTATDSSGDTAWSAGGGSQLWIAGNVGIGTVNTNVGIGSLNPGQALDVQGTTRTTNLTATNGITLGGVTNTSWPVSGNWIYSSSGNIGVSTTVPVGIGTTFTSTSQLTVMGGNVGVGTWIPAATLDVEGTLSNVVVGGNLGIGTTVTNYPFQVKGQGLLYVSNNIGIGTTAPVDALDVNGAVRLAGNLAGGTTGNVGIGTYAANATTCDSVCNTTSLRCFFGETNSGTYSVKPCSVSITGECVCLSAT